MEGGAGGPVNGGRSRRRHSSTGPGDGQTSRRGGAPRNVAERLRHEERDLRAPVNPERVDSCAEPWAPRPGRGWTGNSIVTDGHGAGVPRVVSRLRAPPELLPGASVRCRSTPPARFGGHSARWDNMRTGSSSRAANGSVPAAGGVPERGRSSSCPSCRSSLAGCNGRCGCADPGRAPLRRSKRGGPSTDGPGHPANGVPGSAIPWRFEADVAVLFGRRGR